MTSTTGRSERAQVGQQPLDDRLAVEGRRRARPAPPARPSPAAVASASTIASQNRCASRSPRSIDTHATRSGGCVGLHPGAQQRGLAATGRRAQDDDLARPGARQPVEQRAARHEAVDGRGSALLPALDHHRRLRGAHRDRGAGRGLLQISGQVQTPGSRVLGAGSPAILPPPPESRKPRDDSSGRVVGSGA